MELTPHVASLVYQGDAFDEENMNAWEEHAKQSPDVKWGGAVPLGKLMPFIRNTKPKVAEYQSKQGFTLIGLDKKYDGGLENALIDHGLNPLLTRGIISQEEAKQIHEWYKNPETEQFQKDFELGGVKYRLKTGCQEICKRLDRQKENLRYLDLIAMG